MESTTQNFSWSLSEINAVDTNVLSPRGVYGYIPGLDGIRAIAVMLVLISHFGLMHIVPGGFGVTLFFFISGFLITRLLIAESEKNDRVALKSFYIRRFIRLYPALLFVLILNTAIFYALGYPLPSKIEVLASLGYFMNFVKVYASINPGVEINMSWSPLWSLAVEEHFYLIFPAVLMWTKYNISRLAKVLLAVVCIVPLWRIFTYMFFPFPVEEYNYAMTDARIDSIAWGCLLSVGLHLAGNPDRFRALIGVPQFLLAGLTLLSCFLFRDEMFRQTIRFTLQGGAFFVLFLNLYYLKGLRFAISFLEWKPLVWIGSVSYALYLWHYPVLDTLMKILGDSVFVIPLAYILTFVMAAISYKFVEMPFLRLRRKFGSHLPERKVEL